MLRLVPRPWAVLSVVLIVAGIAIGVAGAELAGMVVGGLGAIGVVALAFYAVGRSEDIERERGRS